MRNKEQSQMFLVGNRIQEQAWTLLSGEHLSIILMLQDELLFSKHLLATIIHWSDPRALNNITFNLHQLSLVFSLDISSHFSLDFSPGEKINNK